jgi:hypothetical protein
MAPRGILLGSHAGIAELARMSRREILAPGADGGVPLLAAEAAGKPVKRLRTLIPRGTGFTGPHPC